MSANDTSSTLLRRALAKDPDAWERLMVLYAPLIHHWCRQAAIPESDVSDITQEVFTVVSARLGTYQPDRPETTFRAWLRGISRHKFQEYRRTRGELAAGGTDAQQRLENVSAPVTDDGLQLSEGPTEIAGVYQRAVNLVRDLFEDRTWRAFWQVAVDGRPPADVAADMGMTTAAVRQAKSRVVRRLKEELGELIA
jgi:RNA polymerase sigma-70 factor (ECF subfamily)